MSFFSRHFDPVEPVVTGPKSRTQVEVILVSSTPELLQIKLHENARPVIVTRRHVKIVERRGVYMTLDLTEKRAIDYNLV